MAGIPPTRSLASRRRSKICRCTSSPQGAVSALTRVFRRAMAHAGAAEHHSRISLRSLRATSQYRRSILLRPVGHRLGGDDDRPLVGAALLHAIAVLLRSFPGRAEAVCVGILSALRLVAGRVQRLGRYGAVRREGHLELDVSRRRGGERLAVEEQGFNSLGGEPSGRGGEKN